MYSCHLFLISSAFVWFIPFLFFVLSIFAWNVPLVSLIFLKRSLVFPILLFSSISLHWSLRKTFLSHLTILWNSAFWWVYLSFSPLLFTSLLFSAICKASSDNHFAFFAFLFIGVGFDPCLLYSVRNHLSIVLQAVCQIESLESISHFHCILVRDLIQVIPKWPSGFPYFLELKSEFGNMIWATVSSQSCFCWLYRASPSLAAKNIINLILVLTIWWCPCVESSLVLLEESVSHVQLILLVKLC